MYHASASQFIPADTITYGVCVTLPERYSPTDFPIDGLVSFNHSTFIHARSSRMH